MPYFEHKEGALWFYRSLAVTGAVLCITYRNDPVSLSAGVTTTVIAVLVLLLPPLIRGGLPLWRSAAATGAIVSLVALIASAYQATSPNRTVGLALAALGLMLAYILSSSALWERWKLQREAMRTRTPASPKGYLDHRVDSAKSSAVITREMHKILEIDLKETRQIKSSIARLSKLSKLPYEERLPRQLSAARRSARLTDKTTNKLAARVPLLAEATETYSQAELAYWRWSTASEPIDAPAALTLVNSTKKSLASTEEYLQALV